MVRMGGEVGVGHKGVVGGAGGVGQMGGVALGYIRKVDTQAFRYG